MTRQRHLLWAAFAATLALGACGGSDSPAPAPAPAPSPAPGPATDRIEPLDTATLAPKAATAKQEVASRLPAGAAVAQVALGALTASKAAQVAPAAGAPLKIGVGRAVDATAQPDDLARLLHWSALPDGSRVAAVSFEASGAQAVRLGVLAQSVPAGTVLRFYGAPGSRVVEMTAADLAALRQLNLQGGLSGDAASMVWGPDTEGAVSTLEVQLPASAAPAQLQLAVPQLSHLTQTVAQAASKADAQIGASGSCNIDVMCTPYTTESRAVARMLFSTGGDSYLCSGTLMNDTKNSQTPYFLTASHCISDQGAASTLVTYWFFRAASCNAAPKVDPAATQLIGGARLLFVTPTYDSTLLQLNNPPPANVLYAGSYFGSGVVVGTDVLDIGHPSGDLQKASLGSVTGYANCPVGDGNCSAQDANNGAMFQIGWRQGTTEGGSSGSALFAQAGNTRYVVGALHGGSASCQNPNGSDFFGRFERSFAAGIHSWLAP